MKRSIEVELPWPNAILNPNSRPNVFLKNRVFQEHKNAAYLETRFSMKMNGVDRIALKGEESTLNIALVVRPAIKRRRDEDNLLGRCKAYIDGISKATEINDCNFHYLEQEWPGKDPQKKGSITFRLEWIE